MDSFSNPVFLILLASWFGVLASSVFLGIRRLKRVYWKNWYDLSEKGPNGEMEWYQIRELMEKDPLQNGLTDSTRRFPRGYLVRDVIGFIPAFTILCASLKLILCDWNADLVKLGMLAGVPALVISVAAIFYQVRLKSRTENRQEWINSLRTEIGVLIGFFRHLTQVTARLRPQRMKCNPISPSWNSTSIHANEYTEDLWPCFVLCMALPV